MEQLLIYIIITALLIFSSIRKNKKLKAEKIAKNKKQNFEDSEDSDDSDDNIDEDTAVSQNQKKIFFDILDKLNQEIIFEDEKFEKNENAVKKPIIFEEKKKKTFLEPKKEKKYSSNLKYRNNIEAEDNVYEAEYSDYEIDSTDELKKAVVYYEIFNKKYV